MKADGLVASPRGNDLRIASRLKKTLIGCSVFLLLVMGAAFYGFSRLMDGDDGCGNVPVQTVLSPDGRLKAITFARDCSALDGYGTHVCIVKAKQNLFSWDGVVFSADVGGAMMEKQGNIPIHLSWTSTSELQIGYDGRAEIQRQSRYLWVSSGFLRGELVRVNYTKT